MGKDLQEHGHQPQVKGGDNPEAAIRPRRKGDEDDGRLEKSNQIIRKLVDVLDALEGGSSLISNQGQPLDGYSALANFRAIAQEAKEVLLNEDL